MSDRQNLFTFENEKELDIAWCQDVGTLEY